MTEPTNLKLTKGSMLEAALKSIIAVYGPNMRDEETWDEYDERRKQERAAELYLLADMLEETGDNSDIVWTVRWMAEKGLFPKLTYGGVTWYKYHHKHIYEGDAANVPAMLPYPLRFELNERSESEEEGLWIGIVKLSEYMSSLWNDVVPRGYTK